MLRHGFQNKQPLLVRTYDGRNCIVNDRLVFRDHKFRMFRTMDLMKTDGGSLPPLSFIGGMVIFAATVGLEWSGWFWWLAGLGALVCIAGLHLESFGRWWWSYVLHDGCYQGNLEISLDDGKTWHPYAPTEDESNELLDEAMQSQRADWWEYTLVYVNLKWFGWRAFDTDRKKRH